MAKLKRQKFDSQVVLGERYRDTVTGYEGVATSIYFFLNGCERVLLEQWSERESKLIEQVFDSPRLEHVETKKVVTSPRTGGYKDNPAAREVGARRG